MIQTEYDHLEIKPMRSALPNEFGYCGSCLNARSLNDNRLVCKLSDKVVRKSGAANFSQIAIALVTLIQQCDRSSLINKHY